MKSKIDRFLEAEIIIILVIISPIVLTEWIINYIGIREKRGKCVK